jgi:hypothetical protein
MDNFKFLSAHIAIAHDGGYILADTVFYTMNKVDIVRSFENGLRHTTPKYTIIGRRIPSKLKDIFKPDYDTLWYFRSKQNAKYLKNIWIQEDKNHLAHEGF